MGIRHICLWVTVVRHAETDLTKARPRILQGQTDYPLNAKGIRQAEALAWRLAKETFTHIISSDLARAKGTTEAIAKYHPEVPVTYDNRLREKDLGDLAGMAWPDAKELLSKEGLSLDDHVSQTGETPQQFEDRVVGFYSDLIERFLLDPNRVDYTESEENLAKSTNLPQATPVGTEPPRTAGRRESLLATAGDLLAKHLELVGISTPKQAASPIGVHNPDIGHLKSPKREQLVPANIPQVAGDSADVTKRQQQQHGLQIKVNHVLVVTHGGTIQELLGHIVGELGFAVNGPPPTGFPKNAGLSRFVISRVNMPDRDYEWEGRLTLYNCVSHLAGLGKGSHSGAGSGQGSRNTTSWGSPAGTPRQRSDSQHNPANFRNFTLAAASTPLLHGQGSSVPPAAGVRSTASLSCNNVADASRKETGQVPMRVNPSTNPRSPRVKQAIMNAGSKLFGGGRMDDRPTSPSSPSAQTGFAIIGSIPAPQQASRTSASKGKSLGW